MAAPSSPPTSEGQIYTDPNDGSRWVGQNGQWVPQQQQQRTGGAGAVVQGVTSNVMGGILKNTGNNLRAGLSPIVGKNMSGLGSGITNAAAGLNEQSAEHDKQSARLKADAQRGYQIGNRDERVEAMKDAAAKEAHVYDTKVNQMDAATGSGTAAFLAQNTQEGDINAHRQRSDAQRAHGEDLVLKGEDATQVAIQERTAAKEADRQYKDVEDANAEREEIQDLPPDEDPVPPGPDDEPPEPDEEPPEPDEEEEKKEEKKEPPPPEPEPASEPPPSEEALIRVRNALGELFDMKKAGKLTDPKDIQKFEDLKKEGEKLSDAAEDDKEADVAWDEWCKAAEAFISEKTGQPISEKNSIKKAANGQGGRKLSDTGAGGKGATYGSLTGPDGKSVKIQFRNGMTQAKAEEAIAAGQPVTDAYFYNKESGDFEPFTGSDSRIKKIKGTVSDRRAKRIVACIKRRFI